MSEPARRNPADGVLPYSAPTSSADSAPVIRASPPARILVVDDELGVREGFHGDRAVRQVLDCGPHLLGVHAFLERDEHEGPEVLGFRSCYHPFFLF